MMRLMASHWLFGSVYAVGLGVEASGSPSILGSLEAQPRKALMLAHVDFGEQAMPPGPTLDMGGYTDQSESDRLLFGSNAVPGRSRQLPINHPCQGRHRPHNRLLYGWIGVSFHAWDLITLIPRPGRSACTRRGFWGRGPSRTTYKPWVLPLTLISRYHTSINATSF
jgi:hypothetical protein